MYLPNFKNKGKRKMSRGVLGRRQLTNTFGE